MSRLSEDIITKLNSFLKKFIEEFNEWDDKLELTSGNVEDNGFVIIFQIRSRYLDKIQHTYDHTRYQLGNNLDNIKNKIKEFIDKQKLNDILNYVSIHQDYINIYLSEIYVRKLEDPKYNP